MIQIPLEIGDTILAGRFKNKKIKVNEIGIDDFGSPTINGRSILKIRIPKLYQKQENEMKTSIKENLSPDKLKTIDKKIAWGTERELPFSQGEAIRTVIQKYKIPAIKWGYIGTGKFIGVETNKQKMFWRDKGSSLEFLGILNKDGSVSENKTLKESYTEKDLKFIDGKAIIKKGNKILAKIIDREVFFKANNMKNPCSPKYPFSLEIGGGIRECDSLEDALTYLNKYLSESNLKESINMFQKKPLEVKIKQTDGSWHIYLQTVDGEECLTMTGWGTKEQAEHAAMMKGYSFDANKSNETPTRDTPKYTGYEKVRLEKPEEMKLSKEKKIEIKLEGMIKKVMKEETATDFKIGDYVSKGTSPKGFIYWIHPTGHWIKLEDPYGNKEAKMFDVSGFKVKTRGIPKKITAERYGKKKALNELEVTDSDLIKEVEEYASAINEIDRLMEQVKKLELRVKELDKKFVVMLEALETELGNSKDTFIRAKNILITIKKRSHERTSFKYKEAFDWLYTRVSPQMKKLIDETLEANKTVSQVKASLSVQYEASNWISNLYSKVKNWFVSNIKTLRITNKTANSELDQLEKMV